jgi:AraC-like DNA-binding protein
MRKQTHTPEEFCSTVELSASPRVRHSGRQYHGVEPLPVTSVATSEPQDRPEKIIVADPKKEERDQREAEQKIEKCLLYMMENLNVRVTISTLSAQAGVSASYFYSLFRRATGYSPGDFLIRARMRRACELLKETGLKVKEVAALLGYGDQFYFSRQFKAVTRLTPSEYRGTAGDSTATQSSVPFNSCEKESSKHFLNRYLSISKTLNGDNSNRGILRKRNGDSHSLHRLVAPVVQPIYSANKAVATVKQNPKP